MRRKTILGWGMKGLAFVRMSSSVRPMNRLAKETSPYLLQHKNNPVDWFPWGQEAFQAARSLNRPILLSIGYSTCHWCHVMERESFENEETAKLMNENFVNIKVDREERPDVDRHYLTFVESISGGGGWPLNVFLTPQLTPFFGGTYFPPYDADNRIGFPRLLKLISAKWKDNPEELEISGKKILSVIEKANEKRVQADVPEEQIERRLSSAASEALKHLEETFDKNFGGFGPAPKFPTVPNLAFLARLAFRKNGEEAERRASIDMLLATLEKIALGGIHDHIEGGFHRYSVDRQWHLPHFEKMLYDQGQLMNIFSAAYALKQLPVFKGAVSGIFNYVHAHLTHPQGAFYCAEDADSLPTAGAKQKKEGAFALWSRAELDEILPKKDRESFYKHYGVLPGGNIDPTQDPHGEMTGLNILDALNEGDKHVQGKSHLEEMEELAEARSLVAERRSLRPRPALDDKILASWNGLMISGLCRAYCVFGLNERYLRAAEGAARFILDHMIDSDAGLHRVYKERKEHAIPGFADDHAFFIQGLLDIYQATLKPEYLETALNLQLHMNNRFWREAAGSFAVGCKDSELPLKGLVDDYDGAEPSSNSVAAMNLGRLYLLTGREEFKTQQDKIFSSFSTRLVDLPFSMTGLLDAFLYSRTPPTLVVINGPSLEAISEFHISALSDYHHSMLLKANIDPERFPKTSAHVCRGTSCSEQVHNAESFLQLLKGC